MKKRCNKCKKLKPLDEFYNAPQGADFKNPSCKECVKNYDKERRLKKKEDQMF